MHQKILFGYGLLMLFCIHPHQHNTRQMKKPRIEEMLDGKNLEHSESSGFMVFIFRLFLFLYRDGAAQQHHDDHSCLFVLTFFVRPTLR